MSLDERALLAEGVIWDYEREIEPEGMELVERDDLLIWRRVGGPLAQQRWSNRVSYVRTTSDKMERTVDEVLAFSGTEPFTWLALRLGAVPTFRRTLLLDHHGVISDGERMPAEWRRLLGEFLTPRIGATPQVWAEGNRIALARSMARYDAHSGAGSRHGHEEFSRHDRIEWMRDMLTFAGVPVPDDAALHEAALEAQRYVTLRAQVPVPGAAATLKALHEHGFRLFTASGDLAENLSNYLTALGVRELFTQTYGADILGVGKNGPLFYAALLAHAALDPTDAVVVDDDAYRLDWARSLGMETVLVGRKDHGTTHPRVERFADLLSVLL